MTDAYIFEVHTDDDVFEKDGVKVVRAKYVFDWSTMSFSKNTDPQLHRRLTSRHKDGRVFARFLTMTKDQFASTTEPVDCYVEKSC